MRKAFKMKLYDGQEKEYEKRHNELWPEMRDMIHEYGGKNYSIFWDKETNILYGYIELESVQIIKDELITANLNANESLLTVKGPYKPLKQAHSVLLNEVLINNKNILGIAENL